MKWKDTIDIKCTWDSLSEYGDEIPIEELKKFINKFKDKMSGYLNGYNNSKLKAAFVLMDGSVANTSEEFADLSLFNSGWNLMYDWADANKIWIKTFF